MLNKIVQGKKKKSWVIWKKGLDCGLAKLIETESSAPEILFFFAECAPEILALLVKPLSMHK